MYPLFETCHIPQNGTYHDPNYPDHEGLDTAPNDKSNPPMVPSIEAGRVIYLAKGAGLNGTQETIAIVQHDGWWSAYGHLQHGSGVVAVGSQVARYQNFARMGYTGYTVPAGIGGTHCHIQTGPGTYHGHLSENPTFDPMTKLQGGSDDMNPTEIIRGIRRVTNPNNPVPDSVIDADAARIMADGRIDGVLLDNLNSVPWRNPEQYNVTSLEIYDHARGGTDPHGFATSRVLGGQDFQAVMNVDMPVYKSAESQVNVLSQKLKDATIDTFRQAYLTRAGEYPTRDQVADWQHSDMDIPSWVNTHASSKTEAELQRQIDIQTRTIGNIQTTTQQDLKDKDTIISRLQAQLAGKTIVEPVESKPEEDGGMVFAQEPEPEKKSGSFLSWVLDIIKAITTHGGK